MATPSISTAIELSNYPLINKALQPLITDKVYSRAELTRIFKTVKLREEVVKKKKNAAEKKLTWAGDDVRKGGYKGIFLGQERIQYGVDFWDQYEGELNSAYSIFGVEPEIICAIIGVETKFGRILGKDKVIESIATLANRGSKLQARQLPAFLRLVKQGHLSIDSKGSYAGAMGIPQFISTSYSAYGVDFSGDGRVDLINNPIDAIGSVANYFAKHGWDKGEPISYALSPKNTSQLSAMSTRKLRTHSTVADIRRAAHGIPESMVGAKSANVIKLLGKNNSEYYHVGLKNFYVITRYNHSVLYAMAVKELSQSIKSARNSRHVAR